MSHELRTPLNAILGFSEMLMGNHGGILRPKQRDYAESIHRSGTHLLTVINDILDLAKIEAGRFELRRIDRLWPDEVARECVELLRERAAARQVAIGLDVEMPVSPINADAGRVKQILLNLLDNAIKFSPAGETVTLTVHDADANTVALIVADHGPGMTTEEILVARQPFSQVDNRLARSHEGSGLGLPLAERLAEVHGGSLQIESEKGRGTRVIVRLPQGRRGLDTASPLRETAAAGGA
jgi:two-component system, cell cycle sensor histidine kinase PleC